MARFWSGLFGSGFLLNLYDLQIAAEHALDDDFGEAGQAGDLGQVVDAGYDLVFVEELVRRLVDEVVDIAELGLRAHDDLIAGNRQIVGGADAVSGMKATVLIRFSRRAFSWR